MQNLHSTMLTLANSQITSKLKNDTFLTKFMQVFVEVWQILCKQPYIFFYNNIGPYWTFPTSQSTYFDIVNTNSITKFYLSWLLVLTGIASTAIVYLICTSPLPCVSKVLRNQILKESNLILQPVIYLMHPFSINRVNTNV